MGSFGGLHHFTAQNAPAGVPKRCTDGCPIRDSCQYDAVDTYLHGKHMKLAIANADDRLMASAAKFTLRFPRVAGIIPGLSRFRIWQEWPTSTITDDLSESGIMQALRTGPYGRCVYHCDNDQVDHQETLINFKNGVTAVLKMHGHAAREGRTLRIDGSWGTIRGSFGGSSRLEVHNHATDKKQLHKIKTDLFGHAEGDHGIMRNFVKVLKGENGGTPADEALVSHQLAFAAHEARIGNSIAKLRIRP